jgi:hypothetical protein
MLALAMGVRGAPLLAVAVVPAVCAFAASTRNDIVPILLGAVVLLFMDTSLELAAWATSAATAAAIGCAVAGWLLLRRASPMSPQRGVTIALLLLIGGAADYILVPALLAGLAAGLCWRLLGGVVQESVQRDIAYLRQPVLAILLLTAGTRMALSIESAVLAGAQRPETVRQRHGPSVRGRGSRHAAVATARALDRPAPGFRMTRALALLIAVAAVLGLQYVSAATGRLGSAGTALALGFALLGAGIRRSRAI